MTGKQGVVREQTRGWSMYTLGVPGRGRHRQCHPTFSWKGPAPTSHQGLEAGVPSPVEPPEGGELFLQGPL